MTTRPGPAELYAQAETEVGPRPRADVQHSKQAWQAKVRDRYRQLMIENGHLIYGEPQPLPCGWTPGEPTTPKENPMVTTLHATLRSSNGDVGHVDQLAVPRGVIVNQQILLMDKHGVQWTMHVGWGPIPDDDYPALASVTDRFEDFTTTELADELARRIRDREAIDAEYDEGYEDEPEVTDVPVAGERL